MNNNGYENYNGNYNAEGNSVNANYGENYNDNNGGYNANYNQSYNMNNSAPAYNPQPMPMYAPAEAPKKGKGLWRTLLKIISVFFLLVFIAAGVVGGIFLDEMNGAEIFWLLGGLLGLVIGVLFMLVNFFVAEVSKNISVEVDLLNSINQRLARIEMKR